MRRAYRIARGMLRFRYRCAVAACTITRTRGYYLASQVLSTRASYSGALAAGAAEVPNPPGAH